MKRINMDFFAHTNVSRVRCVKHIIEKISNGNFFISYIDDSNIYLKTSHLR